MRILLYLVLFSLPISSFCQNDTNEGEVFFKQGKYSKAAQFYHTKISNLVVDFNTHNILAQVNNTQLELCSKKLDLLDALEQKGAALVAMNETNPALHTFITADRLISIMRKSHLKTNSKFSWKKITHNLYEKSLGLCYQEKNNKRAFHFFEKKKSILQLDLSKSKQLLPDSVAIREIELLQASKTAREAASKDKTQHSTYIQTNKELEKFQTYLAEKYPKYYAIHYDLLVPDLKQDRELYSYEKEIEYIHFFSGEKNIYALRFGAGKSKFTRTIRNVQMDSLVKRFSSIDNTHKDFNNLSFQIYKVLLSPLLSDEQFPENLVLLPDDFLKDLPFGKLKIRANSSDELSQLTNIRYAYSIKNLKSEKSVETTGASSYKENYSWKLLLCGGIILLIFLGSKRNNDTSNK